MKYLKFFFLAILVSGFALTAKGQTDKGKFLLGTGSNVNFTSTTTKWKSDNGDGDLGSSSSFIFYPAVGYFIVNNVAVGLEVPLIFNTSKINDNKTTSNSSGISPFVRAYLGENIVKPFLQAAIGFGGGKYTSKTGSTVNSEYSYSTSSLEIDGGLAFFINEKVSIDLKIGYSINTRKDKEDNTNNYKNIDNKFGIGAGVNLIIL